MAVAPELDGSSNRASVVGWWQVRCESASPVLPDGSVDVMWTPGRTPWIAGPDTKTRPSSVVIGASIVGVRLAPGAVVTLARERATVLRNQQVELDAVVGAAKTRQLADKLSETEIGQAPALLAELVGNLIDPAWKPDPLVAQEVARLRAGQHRSEAPPSQRQLRRRFSDALGYGPKFFEQLCRVDRFVDRLGESESTSLAEAAATAGYYDQSHLARDIRKIANCTPGELARRFQPRAA